MSTLVSISGVADSAASAKHEIHTLPVLVVFPHNQCNCRCVMCDIWRIRQANQITPEDLQIHLQSFRELGVQWVVLSGGEPQLNEKWSWLAQMLRSIGSRVTLLSAGLLLQSQAELVSECVDDVIVSLDGPPAIHNRIRRIPNAFEQMADGVRALRKIRPSIPIGARCTVQKANHCSLRAVAGTAKETGLSSISFLAADLTSTAFNRAEPWPDARAERVALLPQEADGLEGEIESLIHELKGDLESGFIVESPDKLRRIVHHFRAHLGQMAPLAPRCNAPWVSAVIEASGDVRPCFFHSVLGNIHRQSFPEIINGPEGLEFRSTLNVAENKICRNCVCSLYIARQP
jgi:MoaA/NifB/PqqE/SkfB family radical SAM enzyme